MISTGSLAPEMRDSRAARRISGDQRDGSQTKPNRGGRDRPRGRSVGNRRRPARFDGRRPTRTSCLAWLASVRPGDLEEGCVEDGPRREMNMPMPTVRSPWAALPPGPQHTAVELCCGMGGIGVGLTAAGYRVIRAYDSWSDAVAVYNHNAPERVARVCDILSNDGRAAIKRERPGTR